MHVKFERLLSKSLTTLEVMAYYLVVLTGPAPVTARVWRACRAMNGVVVVYVA